MGGERSARTDAVRGPAGTPESRIDRRTFLAAGAAVALPGLGLGTAPMASAPAVQESVRALFPRLETQVFLNAAGGTPLGTFADEAIGRYREFWRDGPGSEQGAYVTEMLAEIRRLFAPMVGARPTELAFVPCTKHGEQIVFDGLPALRSGGNVVTNDLHFAGSLNNLEGLRRNGLDVRIVRARDWAVTASMMEAAMDERTALVAVSLVSNVNGHVEDVRALADLAHSRGAYLYADIIQAAGVMPLDVREMGVDFASCNAYKWLFGLHGGGFLFVRDELQGTALEVRMVPGHAAHNYAPWVDEPKPDVGDLDVELRADARRYEAGHPSYISYCALYEGLRFLSAIGIDRVHEHSVGLIRRLVDGVDTERFPCISPHLDRGPIVTFQISDPARMEAVLQNAGVVVSLSPTQMRVSPAIYNTPADIDRLLEALAAA